MVTEIKESKTADKEKLLKEDRDWIEISWIIISIFECLWNLLDDVKNYFKEELL